MKEKIAKQATNLLNLSANATSKTLYGTSVGVRLSTQGTAMMLHAAAYLIEIAGERTADKLEDWSQKLKRDPEEKLRTKVEHFIDTSISQVNTSVGNLKKALKLDPEIEETIDVFAETETRATM